MDAQQITEMLRQIVDAARQDPAIAAAARDAILDTGLFDVFGQGERLNLVDALDEAGEDALRARLSQAPLAELRALVRAHKYDPQRETARWRSAPRFVDFLIEKAKAQLEQEQKMGVTAAGLTEASWML
jgi:hypothetical protein